MLKSHEKFHSAAGKAAGRSEKPAEQPVRGGGFPLRTISFLLCITAFLTAALFGSDSAISRGCERIEQANERYFSAKQAAADMETGSDYLTDRVRGFVVAGDAEYLDDYFREANVTRRRDKALSDLEGLLEGSDNSAFESLSTALALSNELMGREYRAMRLAQLAFGIPDERVPEEIAALEPDRTGTAAELSAAAQSLVFDEVYEGYRDRIRENVRLCTEDLIETADLAREQAADSMGRLLRLQTALTVAMLLMVLTLAVFISVQIRKPLKRMVELMRTQQRVPPTGAAELRFVTNTYNEVLEESKKTRRKLTYEAFHDALTGLYNRSAYEMFIQSADDGHIALLVVDVDKFKSVNDTCGHDVGDRVLKRVAEILRKSFRSVDIICRVGGDEFVVIMTRVNSSLRQLVINKIDCANEQLQSPMDDLPRISVSVGAAFSDRENPSGDIFKDADTALYRVKEAGGCGCSVY